MFLPCDEIEEGVVTNRHIDPALAHYARWELETVTFTLSHVLCADTPCSLSRPRRQRTTCTQRRLEFYVTCFRFVSRAGYCKGRLKMFYTYALTYCTAPMKGNTSDDMNTTRVAFSGVSRFDSETHHADLRTHRRNRFCTLRLPTTHPSPPS